MSRCWEVEEFLGHFVGWAWLLSLRPWYWSLWSEFGCHRGACGFDRNDRCGLRCGLVWYSHVESHTVDGRSPAKQFILVDYSIQNLLQMQMYLNMHHSNFVHQPQDTSDIQSRGSKLPVHCRFVWRRLVCQSQSSDNESARIVHMKSGYFLVWEMVRWCCLWWCWNTRIKEEKFFSCLFHRAALKISQLGRPLWAFRFWISLPVQSLHDAIWVLPVKVDMKGRCETWHWDVLGQFQSRLIRKKTTLRDASLEKECSIHQHRQGQLGYNW